MPKLPRISGQDAISTLERLGFHQARQRGSHVVMRREDRGCVIPLHKGIGRRHPPQRVATGWDQPG